MYKVQFNSHKSRENQALFSSLLTEKETEACKDGIFLCHRAPKYACSYLVIFDITLGIGKYTEMSFIFSI